MDTNNDMNAEHKDDMTTEQKLEVISNDVYDLTQYNAELRDMVDSLEYSNRMLLAEVQEMNKRAGWIKFFTFICALPGLIQFIAFIILIIALISGVITLSQLLQTPLM